MRRHVYFYTHVDQPFEAVADLVSGAPSVWLPEPALPHGRWWLVDLHANGTVPTVLATHQAAVEVGEPLASPGTFLRSITWRSVAADGVLPVLTADLEVTPLSDSVCQLSLIGSYRPPLAVVGDLGDHLAGHRVAEACVRRFVHDVADRLMAATLPA